MFFTKKINNKKTRIDKFTIFWPIVDKYWTTIFKKKILNFICTKKKLHNLIFFNFTFLIMDLLFYFKSKRI